jgi:hypothetical protein
MRNFFAGNTFINYMRKHSFLGVALTILTVGFAQPSWAWRGGGGWGGGWHGGGGWRGGGWGGPGVGLYVGGPYWGDYPYYNDPYYYPPAAYPYPAAYPADPNQGMVPDNVQQADNSAAVNDNSNTRQRAQLDYDYADGDISKAQYDAAIAQLKRGVQQSRNDNTASAPPIRNSAPRSSAKGLANITDLHLELTTLLDQKLKDGDITRAQHDSEATYLNQLESEARNEANATGGRLTTEGENSFTQQFHQAYYSINHNLITH